MEELILISDIHGNAEAVRRVVEAHGRDKEYIILGDIMGLLSKPKRTLDHVQDVGTVVLSGNHDKAIFEKGSGDVGSPALSKFEYEHTMSNLSDKEQIYMRQLPHLNKFSRDDATICAAHARPSPEMASGYEQGNSGVPKREVPEVAARVASYYDYVFLGHTHEQYAIDCSKWGHDVQFVNPGSLGYCHTYANLDVDTGNVLLKQVDVDQETVKDHVREVMPDSMPHVDGWLSES